MSDLNNEIMKINVEETKFGEGVVIKKVKEDMAIELSNRMNSPLQIYNRKVFDSFFGNAVAFHHIELEDKYTGEFVYMSLKLYKLIRKIQKKNDNPDKKTITKNCTHEHVIPKNLYIDFFYKSHYGIYKKNKEEWRNIFTPEYFKKFFDNVCYACLVTKEEDKKKLNGERRENLPGGTPDFTDPKSIIRKKQLWSRYKEAGITVIKPTWKNNKLLKDYTVIDLDKFNIKKKKVRI